MTTKHDITVCVLTLLYVYKFVLYKKWNRGEILLAKTLWSMLFKPQTQSCLVVKLCQSAIQYRSQWMIKEIREWNILTNGELAPH